MMSFGKKYTPVEYLESTGTQYIDTRYYPNNLTDVECKFMYNQFTSNTASSVFGVRDSDGSVKQFLMSVFNGTLWIVNGLNNTNIPGITPLVNTEYILRITPQKAYWNGTEILYRWNWIGGRELSFRTINSHIIDIDLCILAFDISSTKSGIVSLSKKSEYKRMVFILLTSGS